MTQHAAPLWRTRLSPRWHGSLSPPKQSWHLSLVPVIAGEEAFWLSLITYVATARAQFAQAQPAMLLH